MKSVEGLEGDAGLWHSEIIRLSVKYHGCCSLGCETEESISEELMNDLLRGGSVSIAETWKERNLGKKLPRKVSNRFRQLRAFVAAGPSEIQ